MGMVCAQGLSLEGLSFGTRNNNRQPVYLHVYDLGKDVSMKILNGLMAPAGVGAFHAGVEVYGEEYAYGGRHDDRSGIFCCIPKGNRDHDFRKTVHMGETKLTRKEVKQLVMAMGSRWLGHRYDILSHNCLNFADAFCEALDVGRVPAWVNTLANKGATLRGGAKAAGVAWKQAVSQAATHGKSLVEGITASSSSQPPTSPRNASSRVARPLPETGRRPVPW
mmetsp:Transcript_58026/g.149353  ORF Transcript_58026/g.149353 Transcript_58026/m.149353 type:complete len:222 (-) Transcript_58026:104-769(-)